MELNSRPSPIEPAGSKANSTRPKDSERHTALEEAPGLRLDFCLEEDNSSSGSRGGRVLKGEAATEGHRQACGFVNLPPT
jgi:hypothetical protein